MTHQEDSGTRFAPPKSLYIEATGINDDGTEVVVKMRLEAAGSHSELTLNQENLTGEDGDGLFLRTWPTGEHNITISFTRCRFGDLDATHEALPDDD